MKIAISQPTYLPWMGYFDLIDQVDEFVFLDNVQFKKRSWQQRNRIKTPIGLQWLTVPVVVGGRLGQLINEVEIREVEFWRSHCRAIELNYRRSPFFEKYYDALAANLMAVAGSRLVDLNIHIIKWMMSLLGISTRLSLSSEMKQPGRRTELLANICLSLSAKRYVSPLGSTDYLLDERDILTDRGVAVVFQHYEHPEYRQQFPSFLPYASALDLIFNEGDRALELIRSGRREPFQPYEVEGTLPLQAETG